MKQFEWGRFTVVRATVLAACACVAFALAAIAAGPANASIQYCVGTYPGNSYCNQGHYHRISSLVARADHNGFCVYRATGGSAGSPSASGQFYCSVSGDGGFVGQQFYCNGGYPAVYNQGSYSGGVSASPSGDWDPAFC